MSEPLSAADVQARLEELCDIDGLDKARKAREVYATTERLRAEVERLRDLHWREVESLRERLDKEEEERGRQYGMRAQAEERAAFLLELLRATVRTGTKDPLLDARLAEEIRSHE